VNDLLPLAIEAATQAGRLIKDNFKSEKTVNEMKRRDVKLELDVRTQKLITGILLAAHPEHAILGEEEGDLGGEGPVEWIVDPIDGTVNYFYGIPHFCVSIAARMRESGEYLLGVIHDPMQGETWTVEKGGPPRLDGQAVRVSPRENMSEAIITAGFSKSKSALDAGFERYRRISYEVFKTRMLGSAALALAYVATGRLDAYVEEQISLWDIAAGVQLVEAAGGRVILRPSTVKEDTFFICAWNGRLPIEQYL